MIFHGLNKLTLLDFPGHIAATLFTGNCNFRCPFCHNSSLVLNPSSTPSISEEEILSFLDSRKGKLEGVCITGGEPTLWSDLPEFIKKVKAKGFEVKLDTNGTNPDMLSYLAENSLIDFVAVDIKSSLKDYPVVSGVENLNISDIERTVSYLLKNSVPYEFRTTVVKPLHNSDSFRKIGLLIKGASAYYLQQFKDSGNLICSNGLSAFSKDELEEFADIVREFVPNTHVRGE